MTHYNPWQSAETHRTNRVREGMTAADVLRCAGITVATVLLMWAAALM